MRITIGGVIHRRCLKRRLFVTQKSWRATCMGYRQGMVIHWITTALLCSIFLFTMGFAYRLLTLLFMLFTNKGSNISCILLLEKSGGKRIIVKLKSGFKLDD